MGMTDAVLVKHLERLQLPYFVQHYPDLLAQAVRESWTIAASLSNWLPARLPDATRR